MRFQLILQMTVWQQKNQFCLYTCLDPNISSIPNGFGNDSEYKDFVLGLKYLIIQKQCEVDTK